MVCTGSNPGRAALVTPTWTNQIDVARRSLESLMNTQSSQLPKKRFRRSHFADRTANRPGGRCEYPKAFEASQELAHDTVTSGQVLPIG